MKIRVILLGFVCCVGGAAATWRLLGASAVTPETMLLMDDLSRTKIVYSRSGYFRLDTSPGEVSAVFQGDGVAILRVGDRGPIDTRITPERYRELLQTMADQRFSDIAVKRRWGMFLADFGSLQVVLERDGQQRMVFADEKHYVDSPEQLAAIVEMIYSFEKEFGSRFDYGAVATTGISDYRDVAWVVAAGAVIAVLLATAILFTYVRRRKNRAEPTDAADRRVGFDQVDGSVVAGG
jgi:hypothetical protein